MSDRIRAIVDCMERIHECVRNQRAQDPPFRYGALIGEMDWRRELHRLIWKPCA